MKALVRVLAILPLLVSGCATGYDEEVGPSSADFSTSSPPGGGSGGNGGSGQAGVITAGEWSDLRNWSYWLSVVKRTDWAPLATQWQLYPTARYTLTLTDATGQPLAGARVSLSGVAPEAGVTAAVTNRAGQAELFPYLFRATAPEVALGVQVSYRGQSFSPAPLAVGEVAATRALPVSPVAATPVDIMFVVDATGSMGDEINYLKTELRDVVNRASAQLPASDLYLGSVFYRDKGDDYLTRVLPFTQSVDQLLTFVSGQQAGGGGDFPEAVEEGLQAALQQQWHAEARCRLLFLVLDAPPHDEAKARIQQLTREAAQRGIRLIPVTASGIDTSTEFLMRSLALSTAGTYVFITNHSGIGNTHLEATVGTYQVEYLNNLMVRLITEYSQP